MKGLGLLSELQKVAIGEEWNTILNIGLGCYTYFSKENRKNIIMSLIKIAKNKELSLEKRKLLINLYHSAIHNSHNTNDLMTPYSILDECINNIFSLDIDSDEFKQKYSFIRLLVALRDYQFYKIIIIDHLKKYRGLKVENFELLNLNHIIKRKKPEKVHFYKLYDELKKIGVDISLEFVLYLWILDKKKYDKQFKMFLTTLNPNQFIKSYINEISFEEFFDKDSKSFNFNFISQYVDATFIDKKILEYLQDDNYPLGEKIDFISAILNTHNTKSRKIIIDDFIQNIPTKYEDIIKSYSYKEKNNKKILNIEIYRNFACLEWERGKYIHKVISYPDELKKLPQYEKSFPYYITTEGSGYNTTYYARGINEYIPSSPHFTNVEIAIGKKAEKDFLSLGLYDSFEISLENI